MPVTLTISPLPCTTWLRKCVLDSLSGKSTWMLFPSWLECQKKSLDSHIWGTQVQAFLPNLMIRTDLFKIADPSLWHLLLLCSSDFILRTLLIPSISALLTHPFLGPSPQKALGLSLGQDYVLLMGSARNEGTCSLCLLASNRYWRL